MELLSLRNPVSFIERCEAELRPLAREIGLAYWEATRSGRTEDYERVAALEKRQLGVLGREDLYGEVDALRAEGSAEDSPLLARQLEILYRAFRRCQGERGRQEEIVERESALTQLFNNYRAEFEGERRANNFLEQILRNSDDPNEACEAWTALKRVGEEAAPRIRELAQLRNDHARSLGSANYYEFSLELDELDPVRLEEILLEVEQRGAPLFEDFKKELDGRLAGEFGIECQDLRPWHYRDAFFQELPPDPDCDLDPFFADADLERLTRRFYEGIGIDIASILEASDLYEREGKDQHAYCIAIEAPEDVRVLCNLKPTARWMSTMLHEFGHAAYDAGLDPSLPFFLREPAHTLSTEAVAMLAERFLNRADFLTGIAGVDAGRARELESRLRRRQARKLLVFSRWVLVMTRFERGLYEDPGQDLDALWWELAGRFQGLRGEERSGCPDWAAKIHLAQAPVYYQNYLLGEMSASQLLDVLERTLDGASPIDNPDVGCFLAERIFRHGASLPWEERLAAGTGRPLDTDIFIRDIDKGQNA